jgi:hypothetical protein
MNSLPRTITLWCVAGLGVLLCGRADAEELQPNILDCGPRVLLCATTVGALARNWLPRRAHFGREERLLAPLPRAALRLPPDAGTLLAEVGEVGTFRALVPGTSRPVMQHLPAHLACWLLCEIEAPPITWLAGWRGASATFARRLPPWPESPVASGGAP